VIERASPGPRPRQGLEHQAWCASLPAVALEDVQGAGLLDRIDTKFVLPPVQVAPLLAAAAGYAVLEIDGARTFRYTTTYYDTTERTCLRDHLRGRPVRAKVRVRRYEDTATTWLEIKRRQANGRTWKRRTPWMAQGGTRPDWPPELLELLPPHVDATALHPTLVVRYRRTTLLYQAKGGPTERVTIDQALTWSAPASVPSADNTVPSSGTGVDGVILELKQAARSDSPMRTALRDADIRPTAISKYCLGMAALDPSAAPARLRVQLARFAT